MAAAIQTPTVFFDPDSELVQRCQAAGVEAEDSFKELMDRYTHRIRARACRMLGSDADADDIVQEVFVNVHRSIDRYEPNQPFSHWLSVVTRNACRLELRKRAGRDRRHTAYRSDPNLATSLTLDGDPILRDWLADALDELRESTRMCILLRVIEGRTYREVAEHQGMSVPAVKMRVARGLRELRQRFLLQAGAEDTGLVSNELRLKTTSGRSKTDREHAAQSAAA